MFGRAKINYHQKLLSMYRSILAEYLRQRDTWDRFEVPDFLSTGISNIREDIVGVKRRLRRWKITVIDHPDDEGPDDDFAREVRHHRDLLKIHRANLEIYLKQQKQFSEGQTPPMIVNGLQNDRSEIQRIKAILRGWNIVVGDLPWEDEAFRP
jgi:hypothetical protein